MDAERDTPDQLVSEETEIPQSPPVLPLSSQATPTISSASAAEASSQEEAIVVTEKMNSWQVSTMPEPKQYFCLDVSQSGIGLRKNKTDLLILLYIESVHVIVILVYRYLFCIEIRHLGY